MSVCPTGYLQNHTRNLYQFLCMLPMSVARSSSGTLTIGRIAYRREGIFFPIENALSAGNGGIGVHSAGKVCYLRLLCLNLYAHPSVIFHLKLLFTMMILHGFVLDGFGTGTIKLILIKDKSGNLNDWRNYRPITLIPVFEGVVLNLCQVMMVDDLQSTDGFQAENWPYRCYFCR